MHGRTTATRRRTGGRAGRVVAAGLALGLAAGLAPTSAARASSHLRPGTDPAPLCTAAVPASPFADRDLVPQAHRESVDCLAFYDVTRGSGDAASPVFLPFDSLTRGQMASLLARGIEASGFALPEATAGFVDIAGSVHADAINSLAAQGIVTGRTADRFAPLEPVRRDQAASMLLRAVAAVRGVDVSTLLGSDSPFTDVPPGNVHAPAIAGARRLGLVTGVTATTFAPDAPLTRGQTASLVARWLRGEAQASASCTNPEAVYSVSYPADWAVNDGTVLPACSVFDPQPFEVPQDSELPTTLAVAFDAEEVPFDQVVGGGLGEDVVSRVDFTVDGRPAARVDLVATGEGLFDAGLRYTRVAVDRGDSTLIGTTYDAGELPYGLGRAVLTRMALSLDLTGTGLPPFLAASAATAQRGEGVDLDLSAVRTAHHEVPGYGYDRVVLEFTGDGTVGWNIAEWQDEAVLGGSGHVVPVDGDAVLSLAVTGQVLPPQPPFQGLERVAGPRQPVQEVVTGGVFEGVLDAFVATAAPAPYRVFRVGGPERLVVDVQNGAG